MIKTIAIVSAYPQKANKIGGGVEGACSLLANELSKNYSVHIIAPSSDNSLEKRDGLTIHWYTYSRLPGFIGYWLRDRKKINSILALIKPDVVHYQGVFGLSIGCKYPYVATVHGIVEKDILFTTHPFKKVRSNVVRCVENVARKKSPLIISINPYVINELPIIRNKLIIDIPNPTQKDFFKINRSPSKNNKNILFIGRIIPIKNILGIIDAFSEVIFKNPRARLVLAGPIDDQTYYQQCIGRVAEYGIEEQVNFIGAVDRNQLATLLSQASLVTLLSHQENAPMTIIEAMAAGVPVVANNICGIPFIVDDGKSGYLVNAKDSNQVANKMLALLTDESLNKNMGEAGRLLAYKHYHPEVVANKTLAAYQRVVSMP